MKRLILSIGLSLLASCVNAENVGDFNPEQYEHDLDVLIPLVSSLQTDCLMGEETKCAQSNSLMRVIRQHALFNPSADHLSKSESEQMKQKLVKKMASSLLSYNVDFQLNSTCGTLTTVPLNDIGKTNMSKCIELANRLFNKFNLYPDTKDLAVQVQEYMTTHSIPLKRE